MPTLLELLRDGKLKEFKEEYDELGAEQRDKEIKDFLAADFHPLHAYSVAGDVLAITRYFYQNKDAEPNVLALTTQRTPLHYAADFGTFYQLEKANHFNDFLGYQSCITALLNYHANPHLRDKDGKTAFHYVVESANKLEIAPKAASECAGLLVNSDAELWENFSEFHVKVIDTLREKLIGNPPQIVLIGTTLSADVAAYVNAHKEIFIDNPVDFFKSYANKGSEFLTNWISRVDLALAASPANSELRKFKSELELRIYLEKQNFVDLGKCILASENNYSLFVRLLPEFLQEDADHAYNFLLSLTKSILEVVATSVTFAKGVKTTSTVVISQVSYTTPLLIHDLLLIVNTYDKSDKDKLQLLKAKIQEFQHDLKYSPKLFKLSLGDDHELLDFCKKVEQLISMSQSPKKDA